MKLLLPLFATCAVVSAAEFNYHTYWEILPAFAGTTIYEEPPPYWETTSTNSIGDLISINSTGSDGWTVKNKLTGEETKSAAPGLTSLRKVLGLKDRFLALGDSMPNSLDPRIVPSSPPGRALGGWDVNVANLTSTGKPEKTFSFGTSGEDRFVDAVLVENDNLLLAYRSDSFSPINSTSPWVVRIALVNVITGAVLGETSLSHSGEYLSPYFRTGRLFSGPDHKFSYVAPTGAVTDLYIRHMLRVTTLSVAGEAYTVSESKDLLSWTPLQNPTKKTIVWDIPMSGESGYLKFE